jgi:TonB family protein
VLHKVDPAYSKEGEREKIQGTSVYSLIVDKSGRPRDIELMSPIGYGLDEKGIESIQKWVFKPGKKDGMPVSIRATIEINFRFPGSPFDSKAEDHRTSYNAAVHNLSIPERKAKAVESIEKLAGESYPPAMSLLGGWMIEGREVSQDVSRGIDLVRKAADKYDRHGLFMLGMLYVTGREVPAECEKGTKLLREASTYGSPAAQSYLGAKYATGDILTPANPERARYYFRLCAARGNAQCQFDLGKLLTPTAGVSKGDAVQATAWLELAHRGSIKEAEPVLLKLRGSLSDEDQQRAEKMKAKLVRQ